MRTPPILLVLAACTPDVDLDRPGDAPTGAIVAPSDGARLQAGPVVLEGRVADAETPAEHLFVTWSLGDAASDVDATWRDACKAVATADGATRCLADVTAADTRVRMTVTDLAGFQHTDTVTVSVEAVFAPTVSLLAPTGERVLWAGVPFPVVAQVADADDGPGALTVRWQDSLVGLVGGPDVPDAAGRLEGALTLTAGAHRLTVTVTDPGGADASASVLFEVAENHAPTARVEAPTAGSHAVGVPLDLIGRVLDPDVGPDLLTFAWSSDRDGPLGDGVPAADGRAAVAGVVLSTGDHLLTLTATDDAGAVDTATVGVRVEAPPSVTWTSPDDGAVGTTSSGVLVAGTATDDITPSEQLTLSVRSDVDGLVANGLHPAADGSFAVHVGGLSPADHVLTLRMVDAGGLAAETIRAVSVTLPP